MSTTGVDARAYLAGFANALADMTAKDIRAIPDDKWTSPQGGCSKPPCDVTADAVALLAWTAEALKGNVIAAEDPSAPEGRKHVMDACSTPQGAIAALNQATRDFGDALRSASDDALNGIVTPPWKMDAPLFMIAQIAVGHVWYHDGQLNYIQCLLGDGAIHWMDA